jgi:DNA-binding MarR family transcriptional regulator
MATYKKTSGLMLDVDALRSFRSKLRVLEREIGRCLEGLELDKSTLSRAIDSLVELGLVARKEDPENRRQQILSLNKAGERRVKDIHRRCDAYYRQMLGRVPTVDLLAIMQGIEGLAEAMLAQRKDVGRLQCCKETLAKTNRKVAGWRLRKKTGIDV